ncbi:hypothetical protein ACF3OI_10160 (plasmid) [Finegoldia magna]|uniref:hypothetical protein n=1 Tax=Finegoldia magna TaxID=1260 RepID=UPI00370D159B
MINIKYDLNKLVTKVIIGSLIIFTITLLIRINNPIYRYYFPGIQFNENVVINDVKTSKQRERTKELKSKIEESKKIYPYKLKDLEILNDSNMLNTTNTYVYKKFVYESGFINETLKNMSTEDLLKYYGEMNNQDKVFAVITAISRGDKDKISEDKIEFANSIISKEISKSKSVINDSENEIKQMEQSILDYQIKPKMGFVKIFGFISSLSLIVLTIGLIFLVIDDSIF